MVPLKCFNHPEQDAVATCQKCGKGLCRECAEKYTPCLCDSCAALIQQEKQQEVKNREDQRRQKYRSALVDTRNEFIKTALIGIVVGIIFLYIMVSQENDVPTCILGMCMGFCTPFGWKFFTYLQSFFPVVIFGTLLFWFIWFWIKLALSIYVGIPTFIYQVIKAILTQRKISKLQ